MTLTLPPARHDAWGEAWRLRVAHGLLAIPVEVRWESGEKRIQPLVKYRHLWDKTPDDVAFEALWAGREHASGLAILLDRSSNLFAIDTDSREARDWAIETFRRVRTPTFQSARGHKFLFRPPRGINIRSSDGKIRAKVDVKAPNSALVVPPTPGYQWIPAASFDDIPVAPCPDGLRVLLERHARADVERLPSTGTSGSILYATTALERELTAVRLARVGSRNTTLNKAVFAVWRFVLAGQLDGAAVEAAFLRATRGWEAAEREAAKHTIRSAAQGRQRLG